MRVSADGKPLPRHFATVLPTANCRTATCCSASTWSATPSLPPERPLGTTLSKMPGTDLFGYGHIYKFTPDGKLLREYGTATNGGR